MGHEVTSAPMVVGRYALYGKIASGGMAAVHFGRLLGAVGFSRTVAIKRLHPHFTEDPEFVSMFLDEARLAARIRHPNVVATLDVVATGGELFLVMEYIQGETLARLARLSAARGEPIPLPIVAAIFSGVLHGLHAAHEAKNERGEALGIVHRDVSPQNVMVGVDGTARVLDFGVAKAAGRLQTTREGQLKGKISYMAPEQLSGTPASRQTDIYAAAVVLWEALTGKRLFQEETEAAVLKKVLDGEVPPPSEIVPELPKSLDAIVLHALEKDPRRRFTSAREMASVLEADVPLAIPARVGVWVEEIAREALAKQAARVAEIESHASGVGMPVPPPASISRPPPPAEFDADMTLADATPSGGSGPSPQQPSSQMSSISVATPAGRTGSIGIRRPGTFLGGAVAVGAALGVAAFIALRSPAPHEPSSSTAAGTSGTAAEPDTPDTPATTASTVASPWPATSASTAASASAAWTSAPVVSGATTRPSARPPPVPRNTATPSSPKHLPPASPKSGILFTNPG